MTGRHKTGEVCVAVDVESDLSMKDAEGKELASLCKIPIACSK